MFVAARTWSGRGRQHLLGWRGVLILLVVLAGVMSTSPAQGAGWRHLSPTHKIIDINRVMVRADGAQGVAEFKVTYTRDAPGWTLPNQVLRIAFGQREDGACNTRFPRMPLMVTITFPTGSYGVIVNSELVQPPRGARVKMSHSRGYEWRYSITSKQLKRGNLDCVWIAVGDRDDWEWFVNGGAFEGRIPL